VMAGKARRDRLLPECPAEGPAAGVPAAGYFDYLQQLEAASRSAFEQQHLDRAFLATKRAINVVLHTLGGHPDVHDPANASAWAAAKAGARKNLERLKAISDAMDVEEAAAAAEEPASRADDPPKPAAVAAESVVLSRAAAFDFLRPAADAGTPPTLDPTAPAQAPAAGSDGAVAAPEAASGDEGPGRKNSVADDPTGGETPTGPGVPVPRARWDGSGPPSCHVCSQNFSMFTRRHHCRACGGSTCAKCSADKSALPPRFGFGGVHVRVCSKCVVVLNAEKQEAQRLAEAACAAKEEEAARLKHHSDLEADWRTSQERTEQWRAGVQAAAAEAAAAADTAEAEGVGSQAAPPAAAVPPDSVSAPAPAPPPPATRECSVCFDDKPLVVIAPCG